MQIMASTRSAMFTRLAIRQTKFAGHVHRVDLRRCRFVAQCESQFNAAFAYT